MKPRKIEINNIDGFWLKINGKGELENPLKFCHAYDVKARIETEGSGGIDPDYKGSFDFTYKSKLVSCEVVDELGKVTHIKVKGSPSQRLRGRFLSEFDGVGDFQQDWYEKWMNRITINLPEVIEFLKTLKNGEN